MESNNKRRNSILRSTGEDKPVDVTRSKRKISFSRRKSVREFTASEETKAWNNSYDVSDAKNHSEDTAMEKTVPKDVNETKGVYACISTSEDKENINIEKQLGNMPMTAENSIDVTLTERERQLWQNKLRRGTFSFSVIDYEAERLRHSTFSSTIEAEQTVGIQQELLRHRVESREDTLQKVSGQNERKFRFDVPGVECDLDMSIEQNETDDVRSIARHTLAMDMATQKVVSQSKFYDAMDLSTSEEMAKSTPLMAEHCQRRTLHFNEAVECEESKHKAISSRKTIHFDADIENPMDISLGCEAAAFDISMAEAFSPSRNKGNLENIPMEITKLHTFNSHAAEQQLMKPKDATKLVVKHATFAPNVEEQKPLAKALSATESAMEQKPSPLPLKQKVFDESAAIWHVKENRSNDSTMMLANATLDSDATLHEYIMSSGGRLNFRQLNEHFEQGRIKIFSQTPVTKHATTPLSSCSALKRYKSLFSEEPDQRQCDDSNMSLVLDTTQQQNQPLRNRMSSVLITPFRTPLSKSRTMRMGEETPHRSIIEFEKLEHEAMIEQHQIEEMRLSMLPIYDPEVRQTERLPKGRGTLLFDNSALNMNQSDNSSSASLLEKKAKNHRYTVLATQDMQIEEDDSGGQQQPAMIEDCAKSRRYTVLATKAMILDETMDGAKDGSQEQDVKRSCDSVKVDVRFQTELTHQTMMQEEQTMSSSNEENEVAGINSLKRIKKSKNIKSISLKNVDQKEPGSSPVEQIKVNKRRQTVLAQETMILDETTVKDISENCDISVTKTSKIVKQDEKAKSMIFDETKLSDKKEHHVAVERSCEPVGKNTRRQTVLAQETMILDETTVKDISENCDISGESPLKGVRKEVGKRSMTLEKDTASVESENVRIYEQGTTSQRRHTVLAQQNMIIDETSNDLSGLGGGLIESPLMKNNNKNPALVEGVQKEHNRRHTVLASQDMAMDESLAVQENPDLDQQRNKKKNDSLATKNATSLALKTAKERIENKRCSVFVATDMVLDKTLAAESNEIRPPHKSNKRGTILASKEMQLDATLDVRFEDLVSDSEASVVVLDAGKKRKRQTYLAAEAMDLDVMLEHKTSKSNSDMATPKGRAAVAEHLTPTHTYPSHIPVLISSARKSKSILAQQQQALEKLDHSLDTIPVPRRLLKPAEKSVIEIPHDDELFQPKNKVEVFEDNPITISDVSVYFQAQRAQRAASNAVEDTLPKLAAPASLTHVTDVEALPNVSALVAQAPRMSPYNSTVNNFAQFQEHYIHLPCDTSSLIENITLTLERSDNDEAGKIIDLDDDVVLLAEQQIALSSESVVSAPGETFVMPKDMPSDPDIGLVELLRLRQKPKVADVLAQYRRMSVELPLKLNEMTPSPNSTCVREEQSDDWFTHFKHNYSLQVAKYVDSYLFILLLLEIFLRCLDLNMNCIPSTQRQESKWNHL